MNSSVADATEASPIIGPRLARKAPQAMQGGDFNRDGRPVGTMMLTFADSDVDFNI